MGKANGKEFRRFPGVRLSKNDRETVAGMLNKGVWPARVLRRARILQLLDKKWRITDIHTATGSYPATIRNIGYRYIEEGLEAAFGERPRPGAARRLTKEEETRIVAMVCGPAPAGRARWTVRLARDEAVEREIVATVGRETIRELFVDHDLKPWRKKNVVRR